MLNKNKKTKLIIMSVIGIILCVVFLKEIDSLVQIMVSIKNAIVSQMHIGIENLKKTWWIIGLIYIAVFVLRGMLCSSMILGWEEPVIRVDWKSELDKEFLDNFPMSKLKNIISEVLQMHNETINLEAINLDTNLEDIYHDISFYECWYIIGELEEEFEIEIPLDELAGVIGRPYPVGCFALCVQKAFPESMSMEEINEKLKNKN